MKEKQKPDLEELKTRHESDLTGKERRLLERARFQEMNLSEKLRYFWDYYKWTLIVLAAVIFFILEGIGMYRRSKEITLVSLAIMDTPLDASKGVHAFEDDLTAFLGTGNPLEKVETDTSLSSGRDAGAVMKRTVVIAAGLTDAIIINEEFYDELASQEGILPWKEALGDDFDRYASVFDKEGRLDLSGNAVWQSYGITWYEPCYLVLLNDSPHMENAAALADFFLL